jgi:hypothetical protein
MSYDIALATTLYGQLIDAWVLVSSLASHSSVAIRAQALAVIQNIFFFDANTMVQHCDLEQVLAVLRKQLLVESDVEVLERSLYSLCNICAGDSAIKAIVLGHELMIPLATFLVCGGEFSKSPASE